jgi:hypothetical protein
MIDIKKLYEEKKWLFFLAIPLVILIALKDLLIKMHVKKIDKAIDDAEVETEVLLTKEEELVVEQVRQEVQADIIRERLDSIEAERAANRAIPDNDEEGLDWHE